MRFGCSYFFNLLMFSTVSIIPSNLQYFISVTVCKKEGFTLCKSSYTVPSKSSWTKWKYFLTISRIMLILNGICKQYGSWSGPTKRGAWSSIHIVWYPASFFAGNLGCITWDELNSKDIIFFQVYKLSKNSWRTLYNVHLPAQKGLKLLLTRPICKGHQFFYQHKPQVKLFEIWVNIGGY